MLTSGFKSFYTFKNIIYIQALKFEFKTLFKFFDKGRGEIWGPCNMIFLLHIYQALLLKHWSWYLEYLFWVLLWSCYFHWFEFLSHIELWITVNWILVPKNSFLNWISFLFSSFLNQILTVFRDFLIIRLVWGSQRVNNRTKLMLLLTARAHGLKSLQSCYHLLQK